MAEGHRQRLRERFNEENIDTIPEYIVLEMMLQGIISRCDTCELARTLIKEFGGLAQVIDAPVTELMKVKGMGERAASFIKLIPKFYRKYCQSKWDDPTILNSTEEAGQYMLEKLSGYDTEVLLVACLDTNCKLISCKKVFEGSINAVNISNRKIVEFALQCNASRVILAHNHISGNALPSDYDHITTKQIIYALKCVDIKVDDHIIVAGNDYVSFSESGFFEKN